MNNRIINDSYSDYHIHSTFSDGTATIEEIVQYAGKLGMKEIAITDHSDFIIEKLKKECGITPSGGARYSLSGWQNVHNDVKVIFGVEGDVINEEGDACLEHQKMKGTFTILSLHRAYESEPATATKGLLKSIERHHKEIHIIGHPYDKSQLGEYIDIKQIVEIANDYHIAMEFNRGTFSKGNTISENLMYMLENAKQIYVNSDAHSLSSLGKLRKECFAFLEERGIT